MGSVWRWVGGVFLVGCFVLAAVGTHARADERTTSRLFTIRRSLNGNQVAYDAALRPDGRFVIEEPIQAYWILEKGGTEPLSGPERRRAYGVKVHLATPEAVRFTLKPLPGRVIDVRKEASGIQATTLIAGERSTIDDIFVESSGGVVPKVSFVEIKGRSLADGKERRERIVP